jgi:hypothetical protein
MHSPNMQKASSKQGFSGIGSGGAIVELYANRD